MLTVANATKVQTVMAKLDKQLTLIANNFLEGTYDSYEKPLASIANATKTCASAITAITSNITGKDSLKAAIIAADHIDKSLESVLQVSAKASILLQAMEGESEMPAEPAEEEVTDEIDTVSFGDDNELEATEGEKPEEVVTEAGDMPDVPEEGDEPEEDITDEIEDLDDALESESMVDEGEEIFGEDGEEPVESESCGVKKTSSENKIVAKQVRKTTVQASSTVAADNLEQLWDMK